MSAVNNNQTPPPNGGEQPPNDESQIQKYSSIFFVYVIPFLILPVTATVFVYSLVTKGDLEVLHLFVGAIAAGGACLVGRYLNPGDVQAQA